MKFQKNGFEVEYGEKDICAVIVSYNPTAILLRNIESLLKQVSRVLVVDNGSTDTKFLTKVEEEYAISMIKLKINTGVAYALNQGLSWCIKNSYKLMLTMDQDTILSDNAVLELLKAMHRFDAQSVGINWDKTMKKDEEVSYLITSGNLVFSDIASEVGGYDDQLFIDSVDFDFSLRLSDYGYKMIKVTKAIAEHQIGERQEGSNYTTHSVNRYYYIYRNHFYLTRKYWQGHKLFCLKKHMALAMDFIEILLKDTDRCEKIKMLRRGYLAAKSMNYTKN